MATQVSTQMQQLWMSDFGSRYPNSYSYYSGSTIVLYMGNKLLLDECAFISYDLQQNKRPIYGYASQYWDAIAKGTILVQGSLGINYFDNKYLFVLLWEAYQQQNNQQQQSPVSKPAGLDQMAYLSQLAGYNTLTAKGMADFQVAVAQQQSQIWGQSTAIKNVPRPDTMPAADIFITYGNNPTGSVGSTTKRLEQVSFIGETQQIEINGQPIFEVYQFLARQVKNELPPQGGNT
jgi:hypothetical protein